MKKMMVWLMASAMSLIMAGCRNQNTTEPPVETDNAISPAANVMDEKTVSATSIQDASIQDISIQDTSIQSTSKSTGSVVESEATAPETKNAKITEAISENGNVQEQNTQNADSKQQPTENMPSREIDDLDHPKDSTIPETTAVDKQQEGPKVDEFGNDEL